jgi:hypothetical protein
VEPADGEREDDVVAEQEEDRVGRHADAVEQRLRRPLQRQERSRPREREQRPAEAVAGAPDQPEQRGRDGAGDDERDFDRVRRRVDEVVARGDDQAAADGSHEAAEGDRDEAGSPDRKRRLPSGGDGGTVYRHG